MSIDGNDTRPGRPAKPAGRGGSLVACGLLADPPPSIGGGGPVRSLLDDGEHVARREDEVLLTGVLHLGAAVLAVEHGVADLDVERNPLFAFVVEPAGADRKDFALLGLLLGGVRDDQAGGRRLLRVERLDDNTILERLDGGRHVRTSPSETSNAYERTVSRCSLDRCVDRRRGAGRARRG